MDPAYWDDSIEAFKRLGPPLRPHASEIRCLSEWIAERFPDTGSGRVLEVLVLGVTVELVTMSCPRPVRLTALDRSEAMIRTFWPGQLPGRRLVRGDWDRPPLRPAAFDLVLGDGPFNTRAFPEGYLELGSTLSDLLTPHGVALVRGFVQSDPIEDPDSILDEYRSGAPVDYHGLRFRFQTSLQPGPATGVPAGKDFIDEHMRARGISLEALYARTGYEPPPRRSRAAPRPAPRAHVSYPTLAQFEAVLAPNLQLVGRRYGDHPLAHRCPIFALEPKTRSR